MDSERSTSRRFPCRTSDVKAFTLVEVMVSMVVLAIMMMLIAQIIGTTQRSWRAASSRLSQFREARMAFDTITRNLRQATINPYRDFHYANGSGINKNVPPSDTPTEPPDGFVKISELAFISGQASDVARSAQEGKDSAGLVSGHAVFFQAPLGVTNTKAYENLKNLLCTRGYFVQFGPDTPYLPSGLRGRLETKNRFRLMEYQPPAENNSIYKGSDSTSEQDKTSWYQVDTNFVRPVSDKIAVLVISPRFAAGNDSVVVNGVSQKPTAIAANYAFDSRDSAGAFKSELPPLVRVTMVAVDDASQDTLVNKAGGDVLQKAKADFTNADSYDRDMSNLKGWLGSSKINYRIFESYVPIPASSL